MGNFLWTTQPMEYNIPGFIRMYYYLYEHGTMNDIKVLYNCQHGMTPLHNMIAMDPYTPSHFIDVLVHANMDDVTDVCRLSWQDFTRSCA